MLSLAELAEILSTATLRGPAALRASGVSTDTRGLQPGDLFVALSGARFDGHAFLETARAAGAAAAVIDRSTRHAVPAGLPVLEVDDTRRALGEMARAWRLRFDIPVVLVVGSNGKTTTKEMVASIFRKAFGDGGVLATAGTLNNEIGLPLTLLKLRTAHQAAVIELGMNHPEETRWLADVARPTVTVVTNAQREHQEFMGSVAAVANEHALAIDALRDDGVAVLPAADPHVELWRARAAPRTVLDYAIEPTPAQVTSVAYTAPFATVVHLATPAGPLTAKLATAGLHNVHNATAAAAAAVAVGIGPDAMCGGLEAFVPVAGRMQAKTSVTGGLLIDDSYNANPDSVRAAIDVLADSPQPALLVLGDMGEVGAQGAAFHAEVGAYARERGVAALYATGVQTRAATLAFGAAACHFEAIDGLIDAARAWLGAPGHALATILVKGSRFTRMERAVAALAAAPAAPPHLETS